MYFESVMIPTLLASTTVGSSLKESSRFCPTQTWDAPSSELSAEQRLKRESVRFVVSFLDGLSDYIVDTVVSSTDSRLELSTKFSSAVSGEVATRSKLPLCFHGASSGEVRLSIGVTDHGTVRLELEPGSLSHAPVEGAVEASNRFFKDFTDKGLAAVFHQAFKHHLLLENTPDRCTCLSL